MLEIVDSSEDEVDSDSSEESADDELFSEKLIHIVKNFYV